MFFCCGRGDGGGGAVRCSRSLVVFYFFVCGYWHARGRVARSDSCSRGFRITRALYFDHIRITRTQDFDHIITTNNVQIFVLSPSCQRKIKSEKKRLKRRA